MGTLPTFNCVNGQKSRKSVLRTVDVARGSGYSVQQIRDLERTGVLPPAHRTQSGYRVYHDGHLQAALAYRQLAAGIGPVAAKTLLRNGYRATPAELVARLDEAHADLHRERTDLRLARRAAAAIAAEPIPDVGGDDTLSISELAEALGVRTSTLRHWDAEGLVVPQRDRRQARSYPPEAVRDARIVHQLRLAGYRVEALRALLPQLRSGSDATQLEHALASRETALTARSQALTHGGAALLRLRSLLPELAEPGGGVQHGQSAVGESALPVGE